MTELWEGLHLGLILGGILTVTAAVHILQQRISPGATAAWLFFIIILPYVGVPCYFIFGTRKLGRHYAKEQLHLDEVSTAGASLSETDRLLRSYGIPAPSPSDKFQLSTTGEMAYQQLISLIKTAERTIYVETFILHMDSVGTYVRDLLVDRAKAGLKVRLLLDGVGSFETHRAFLEPLKEAGGEYAFFLPMRHRPFRGSMNWRNHRKLIIIDGKQVLMGGMNVALEYMGPEPLETRWHDLACLIEGRIAAIYEHIFRSDWFFATSELLPASELVEPTAGATDHFQVVPSGPDVREDTIYDLILNGCYEARQRLWIATPYFIPDENLTKALELAAHRGIDVQLLIPKKSNHHLADVARGSFLRRLARAGVTVNLWEPGMLHAKAWLIDDQYAVIGSANLDLRSLFLNYEVAQVSYSSAILNDLAEWFTEHFRESCHQLESPSWRRRMGEGFVRLIAPLL